MKYDYDVAILGGGSAGYAAARTAAGAGLKTVVIEGGEEVGGLCILRGCMPSKALLYAAEVRHLARQGTTWGLKPGRIDFDFTKDMARKVATIEDFASYRRQQLENGKFKLIRAKAMFANAHTLELKPLTRPNGHPLPFGRGEGRGEGKHPRLTAKHFVIATGSVGAPPPGSAVKNIGYLTSDEALSLKKLPKSLIVLGGGAIACELAQFFVRFDVKVTMIQRSSRVLKEFDEDACEVVETVFRREGIKLFTDTKLIEARSNGKRKVIEFEHNGRRRRVEADEVLFALGGGRLRRAA